jgi:DNA-directed RNA polymerase specialized sigma24 family protein
MLPTVKHRTHFPITDWNLVVATRRQPTSQARGASAELCSAYWYPIYAYLRRRGHRADEAEDLTQGFFVHVIAQGILERAQPDKGRLRSFLLASLTNYVANDRNRLGAQKRGGTRPRPALKDAESRYRLEPIDALTPERIYERQWAITLLTRVLARLRADFARAGKHDVFDVLKMHLAGEKSDALYRRSAEKLGISVGAARVAAHRLRRRYRELLRAEIERTVSGTAQDVDDEVRYLFSVTQQTGCGDVSTLAVRS